MSYKRTDPEYENCFWLKGVSLTRSKKYAQKWGDVVYQFDQSLLAQRYKFMPIHWANASSDPWEQQLQEYEEFVVLGKVYHTMRDFIDNYNDRKMKLYDLWKQAKDNGHTRNLEIYTAKLKSMEDNASVTFKKPPSTKITPLDKYIVSIKLDEIHKTLGAKNIELITNHPKFQGYF